MNTLAPTPASAAATAVLPSGNAPQMASAEELAQDVDDFASLLAASWFSLSPATTTPVAAASSAEASVAAAASAVAQSPAITSDQPLALTADQLAAAQSQMSAEALALALRNAGKVETSDALGAVSQRTAETISGRAAEQLQAEEVAAAWLPQGQSWRTEAASRESVSVASILAENSRLMKSALTASSLKPSFEEVSALHKLEADQALPLELTETALAAKMSLGETQLHASLRDGLSMNDAREVARSVAEQIAEPLIEVFEKLSRRESGTLRLQLNPDDLGRVDVQITRDAAGRLSAQLSAEHEAARRALNDGIGQLRETLERVGITVERLDVGVNTNTGSNNFAGQHQDLHSAAQHLPGTLNVPDSSKTTLDGRPAAGSDDRIISIRA